VATPDDEPVTPREDPERVVADVVSQQIELARAGVDLERLAALDAKVADALRSSRAEATLRAYSTDVADFREFCRSVGLDWMPAEPATVAAYIAELASPPDDRAPMAASTIRRRLAGIGEAHKHAGVPNPCMDPLVKQVMQGVRRQIGVAPRHRKVGLSTADVRAIVETLDGAKLIDVRDKALLLLGFATALRRSELVALDVEDVENHPEGLLVWRRRSKTDQESRGHRVEVAYGNHVETCPVRAYRTWLDEAGIDSGPVFRAVNRHAQVSKHRLSDRSVADVIKKHVTRLGYPSSEYAGHSLRRGFATEAARNGAPERTIASTTGHTTTKGLQPYIADAEVMKDPPSRYLDL
jgi:site-specific recombinase XerD